MGWGRKSVVGTLAALAVVCSHHLSACQLPQTSKPEHRTQSRYDVVGDFHKRVSGLFRASAVSTVPSRRIILQ
ncbi:MAG: hypothetical protein V4618_15685 [Pseudomonadota bacterium]